MPYLQARALDGLRDYQFKPGGYTVLDNLHQPFWNYLTSCLPMWLAPNLITLTGVFGLVAAYFLSAFYLPEFEGTAPRWTYFFCGSACLAYLHLDCIDGKQARRTKTSSPLGQLFDHGCDAIATYLIVAMLMGALNIPTDWRMLAFAYMVYLPWILAHWEEYHTGTMVYGNGWWGVTEANYGVVALQYITAAIGPARWHARPLAALVSRAPLAAALPPRAAQLAAGLQLNELFMLALAAAAVSMSLEQAVRVFRLAGTKALEHTTLPRAERGSKVLTRGRAVLDLVQLAAMFGLGAPLLLLAPGVAAGQARLAMATFGVVYALQSTRLIMAHMAKEPFEVAVWPLAAMAAQGASLLLPSAGALDPVLLAYSVTIVVVVGYLHYIVAMIREICAFLDIPCLTIRPKGGSKAS